jgi:hypothetical protein
MDAAAANAGDISELRAGLADTSCQYSKRCLEFTGNGLPDRCLEGANDGVKFLVERIVGRILRMDLTELNIAEIGVCHYMNPVDRYMIAKFNCHCTGSVFDRLLKASRALSKKKKDGATVREVKVWIRIAVYKRDQHSMFLLRQMSKTGQAVAVDLNKGGKPTALVLYGESKEYRRLQFETAEDVRAVMNDESRAKELKAE